jgi:hypothetical protein
VNLCTRDLGYQWQPTLIDQDVVFAAELATIGWVPASMFATTWRRNAGSINASPVPNDLVVLFAKPPEYRLVDASPDPCLHPLVKATPACHATTAPEFTRQILPGHAGPKHEQNAGKNSSITDTWTTALRGRRVYWKMIGDKGPELVGKECFSTSNKTPPLASRATWAVQ